MKKEFKYKSDLQHFATPTFTPDNVLLMDAMSGSVPAEEGTLILKDFMSNSVIMQLAKPEVMTKPEKNFTFLASGPGAYWVGEGEMIQTDKATWLDAKMTAHKLGVILPVSKEFLKYTKSDFFNEMKPAVAEAFYQKFDQATLFGANSPYPVGQSIWERITTSGNKIEAGSTANMYTDLNALLATVEDGDHEPNGFTTTRSFKKDLRGAVDSNNIPIFNGTTQGVANEVLGLPIGYVAGGSWDKTKALAITGDWDYARYGILQGLEYEISTDATLNTVLGEDGEPINLFERDLVAMKVTMMIGFMTLKEDAFAALTPKVIGG